MRRHGGHHQFIDPRVGAVARTERVLNYLELLCVAAQRSFRYRSIGTYGDGACLIRRDDIPVVYEREPSQPLLLMLVGP